MTGSTGRTSYADLMGDAAHHVAVAATALSRERLPDAATARATVESYWQLLASPAPACLATGRRFPTTGRGHGVSQP